MKNIKIVLVVTLILFLFTVKAGYSATECTTVTDCGTCGNGRCAGYWVCLPADDGKSYCTDGTHPKYLPGSKLCNTWGFRCVENGKCGGCDDWGNCLVNPDGGGEGTCKSCTASSECSYDSDGGDDPFLRGTCYYWGCIAARLKDSVDRYTGVSGELDFSEYVCKVTATGDQEYFALTDSCLGDRLIEYYPRIGEPNLCDAKIYDCTSYCIGLGYGDGICSEDKCECLDTISPSCSISSISEFSDYSYSLGTTIWYNSASSDLFTVDVDAQDNMGVTNVNFPTTVSAGGNVFSPPYSWEYRWDTLDTYSGKATVTAYDTFDNTGTCSFTVTRDVTAPETTPSISGSYTIALGCTDNAGGSGCYQTKYCTDTTDSCTPTNIYTGSFIESCSFCCYVRYYSIDNVNNKEEIKSKEFGPLCGCTRYNPTVTISPSSQSGSAGSTLTYTVNVKNNDNSECGSSTFSLSYSVPSGWTGSLSGTSLTINPGSTSITSFSVTSPLTALGSNAVYVTAINGADNNYYDTGSAIYEICIDECSSGSKRCSGSWVQECKNCDADGCVEWCDVKNCAELETEYICKDGECVDGKPPETKIQCNDVDCLTNCWYSKDVKITLSCSDEGSGCEKTYYCFDQANTCSPTNEYIGAFNIITEGTNYVRYFSRDKAGNVETVKSQVIYFNKTLPETLEANIIVRSLGGETNPVSLSYFIDPSESGISVTFDPDSGVPNYISTMTIKASPLTLAGTYTITIIGTGGGLTRTADYNLTIKSIMDFTLDANPDTGTVEQGKSISTTINLNFESGLPVPVYLSVSGKPPGSTIFLSTDTCTPTCSSTMIISTSESTPVGVYLITITGIGGGLKKTITYTLTVERPFDFKVDIFPLSDTVTQGESTTATVSVELMRGTTQTVDLSYSVTSTSTGNLEPTISVSFNPASDELDYTSTMTITTQSNTPADVYAVVVAGTDGGLIRTKTFTLTVEEIPSFDFSLDVTSDSLTIDAGGPTGFVDINVILESGTSENVDLSVSGFPDNVWHFLFPNGWPAPYTSTLQVQAECTAIPGTYTITVTGTSVSGVTHSDTFKLIIKPVYQFIAPSVCYASTSSAKYGNVWWSEDESACGSLDPDCLGKNSDGVEYKWDGSCRYEYCFDGIYANNQVSATTVTWTRGIETATTAYIWQSRGDHDHVGISRTAECCWITGEGIVACGGDWAGGRDYPVQKEGYGILDEVDQYDAYLGYDWPYSNFRKAWCGDSNINCLLCYEDKPAIHSTAWYVCGGTDVPYGYGVYVVSPGTPIGSWACQENGNWA